MRNIKVITSLLGLVAMTGCTELGLSDSQEFAVATAPRSGAECSIRNDRGVWAIPDTPSKIIVTRSASPLDVACRTVDGLEGHQTIGAQTGVVPAGPDWIYPDHVVIALAPPVNAPRPMFGSDGGRGIAPPLDLAADSGRQADDNVAIRFQTLRVLLDEGLITRDEYNTRRGANLGALLRYTMTPPARDLTRPAPSPETLVSRLRYLAGAYSEHSISAAEQAAERSVILDRLLPAPVVRRADTPPPIRDELQMAAEIGRIERMKEANVITDAEAAKERAKVTQLLDAAVAASDAAARAAAGMGATPVSTAHAGVSGPGVALSTHSSEAQARRAWASLKKAHPSELGSLKLSLKKIPRPHRPSHYQIVAGPLPDRDAAVSLCKSLRQPELSCDAATFTE